MSVWLACTAASLLSVERVAYALIWRDPARFRRWSGRVGVGGPIEVLVVLFVAFKVIQIAVFIGWHLG
jgi:hypothetical protein